MFRFADVSMEKKYRKNSGIVLQNRDGLVFVGKRSDLRGPEFGWQMPQGGVDHGETYKKTAARELQEEVGIKNFIIVSATQQTYKYNFPNDTSHFGKGLVGQKQKWFLAKFLGEDSEIRINYEFSEWKWMSVDELMSLIVDFKKDIYTKVFEEFKDFFP